MRLTRPKLLALQSFSLSHRIGSGSRIRTCILPGNVPGAVPISYPALQATREDCTKGFPLGS